MCVVVGYTHICVFAFECVLMQIDVRCQCPVPNSLTPCLVFWDRSSHLSYNETLQVVWMVLAL